MATNGIDCICNHVLRSEAHLQHWIYIRSSCLKTAWFAFCKKMLVVAQDRGDPSALAMKLLQSCSEFSNYGNIRDSWIIQFIYVYIYIYTKLFQSFYVAMLTYVKWFSAFIINLSVWYDVVLCKIILHDLFAIFHKYAIIYLCINRSV